MTIAASTEDLSTRISDAQAEIAAALLFYTPRPAAHEIPLAYQRDQLLKSLVHISDGLANGFPPYPVCEACGKPINAGEPYVNDSEDALDFHPECIGVDPAGCARVETREEQAADLAKRVAETRAYLDAGGYLAGVEERTESTKSRMADRPILFSAPITHLARESGDPLTDSLSLPAGGLRPDSQATLLACSAAAGDRNDVVVGEVISAR